MRYLPILFLSAAALSLSPPLHAAESPAAPAPRAEKPSKEIKNVTVTEAEQLVRDKKVAILDVRTPAEFSRGHIAGATNIDFHATDFEKQLAALDKSKSYLVHCASGVRSAKTLDKMKTLDFKSVYHMNDGMKGWEKAGKPVEK